MSILFLLEPYCIFFSFKIYLVFINIFHSIFEKSGQLKKETENTLSYCPFLNRKDLASRIAIKLAEQTQDSFMVILSCGDRSS
jgi:hypothetical protein